MIVRLLPGQVVDDYRMVARRLAEALHVPMIRVRPHGLGYLRIELLHRDPLAEALPLHLPTATGSC